VQVAFVHERRVGWSPQSVVAYVTFAMVAWRSSWRFAIWDLVSASLSVGTTLTLLIATGCSHATRGPVTAVRVAAFDASAGVSCFLLYELGVGELRRAPAEAFLCG